MAGLKEIVAEEVEIELPQISIVSIVWTIHRPLDSPAQCAT